MKVQVIVVMSQYRIPKDESRNILGRWFHVVTFAPELCHITHNSKREVVEYLDMDSALGIVIAMWLHHIYHFNGQYYKAFMANALFGANLLYKAHKRY